MSRHHSRVSFAGVFKLLLDDFVRERWGDLIGMALILAGVMMEVYSSTPAVNAEGHGLIGAGLFALRPKTMTNGKHDASTGAKK